MRVVLPVPPFATESVPVSVTVPVVVIGPPVNERPVVPPLACTFVTPVLAITPVEGLYEIPVPAESDDEEILLLKVAKSVNERNPF